MLKRSKWILAVDSWLPAWAETGARLSVCVMSDEKQCHAVTCLNHISLSKKKNP